MIAIFLVTMAFARAIGRAMRAPETQALVIMSGVTIAVGTVFYMFQEEWSLLDALYFTVMTLATVGFGDLVPTTGLSKIFTAVYVLVGIGLIATTATAIAVAANQDHDDRRQARAERNEKAKLQDPPSEA